MIVPSRSLTFWQVLFGAVFCGSIASNLGANPISKAPLKTAGSVMVAIGVNDAKDFKNIADRYDLDFESYIPEYGTFITPLPREQLDALRKEPSTEVALLFDMRRGPFDQPPKSDNAASANGFDYELNDKGEQSDKSPWKSPRYDSGSRLRSEECNLPDSDQYSAYSQQKGLHAPDKAYQTNSSVKAKFNELASIYRFRDLIHIRSLDQKTSGGNLMQAILVTAAHGREVPDMDKPNIVFGSLTHARELMTMEVAIDIAEELAKNYDRPTNDPESTKAWLDKTNIWIIPVINPDGLDKVWGTNAKGEALIEGGDRIWRKNGNGVDIGRNFPQDWGACGGSTSIASSQNYRGPSAASEIETQNLIKFFDKYKPVMFVSFHSAGEYVLTPGTCRGQYVKNRNLHMGIAKRIAEMIPGDCSTETYRYGELFNELYNLDGEMMSYTHFKHGSVAFLIEMNDGRIMMQPNYDRWRQSTVEKMRGPWKYLINRIWGPAIYGHVTVPNLDYEQAKVFVIPKQGNWYGEMQVYPVKRNGYYHILLEPGTYKIVFSHPKYEPTIIKSFEAEENARKEDIVIR